MTTSVPFPAGPESDYVAIFTALPTESRAVSEVLRSTTEHWVGTTVYTCGVLETEHGKVNVALAELGPGNNPTAVEFASANAAFLPACFMFVGVAGGLKDVSLLDTVVARRVTNYERIKVDGQTSFRTDSYPIPRLIDQIGRLLKRQRTDSSDSLFVEPIASGEKVVASSRSEVASLLRTHCSDAVAVEMEGAGFATAGFILGHELYGVVRGISDLLDDKSDGEDLQPQAARNAMSTTVQIIEKLCQGNRIQTTSGLLRSKTLRLTIETSDDCDVESLLARLKEDILSVDRLAKIQEIRR